MNMIQAQEIDGELWVLASDYHKAIKEDVAKWMIDRSYATGHGDTIADLLKELEWQIRESEREACAKIADEWAVGWPHPSAVIAEQIRARGNT